MSFFSKLDDGRKVKDSFFAVVNVHIYRGKYTVCLWTTKLNTICIPACTDPEIFTKLGGGGGESFNCLQRHVAGKAYPTNFTP